MKLTATLLISFMTALALPSITALPGGAPKCIINPPVIAKGHEVKGPTTAANFGLSLAASSQTYTPGQQIQVSVNANQAWKGLLMYAAQGAVHDFGAANTNADSTRLNHVGNFALPAGYRAQSASACQTANIVNDVPTSTITHSNTAVKNTPGQPVTFQWTGPAQDVGPVTLTAVVSMGSEGSPFSILNQVTLMPAGGAGRVAPAAASAVPAAGAPAGGAATATGGTAAAPAGGAANNYKAVAKQSIVQQVQTASPMMQKQAGGGNQAAAATNNDKKANKKQAEAAAAADGEENQDDDRRLRRV